jgi:hypothetical protein
MRTVATDLPVNVFGGVAALGATITSLDGTHVSVSGSSLDGAHFGGPLPPLKDRGGDNRTAFFAVLGPSPERRAVMDDQTLYDQNPYVVAVIPARCEDEGELYVPEGAVPEDAKFLVAVVSRDTSDAHLVEGDRTTTVYVEPR